MALKYVRIGSMENIHVFDDATHTEGIETDATIKAAAPVDPTDVIRLADVGSLVGNVIGPAASTDNAIVRFNGITGELIQNSSLILDNNGNLSKAIDDLEIDCGANKTIALIQSVYDDLRIVPGSFDRPGVSDPNIQVYAPGGGALSTYLYEFDIGDIVSFAVQIPHSYKLASNISVHLHWTPGGRGVAENGKFVGWKVDYSWANIDGTFGAMATADLSDVCDGTNHKHQMTPEVSINGAGKDISSMLMCNLKRTDLGADDTWATNTPGNCPMILEVDFHFIIDTLGSRQIGTK